MYDFCIRIILTSATVLWIMQITFVASGLMRYKTFKRLFDFLCLHVLEHFHFLNYYVKEVDNVQRGMACFALQRNSSKMEDNKN